METDSVDRFFAMVEDSDVDFIGKNEHPDVPVLSYRWSRGKSIAECSIEALVEAGEKCMQEMGLKRVVRHEHHLRGDTETGQRVKMTVLKSGRQSMYLIMTAGLPGTRDEAKRITAQLATKIEKLAADSHGTA